MKQAKGDKILDETLITEITLQADGRVYVFGLSRDVLEILHGLNPDSQHVQGLLGHVQAVKTEPRTCHDSHNEANCAADCSPGQREEQQATGDGPPAAIDQPG